MCKSQLKKMDPCGPGSQAMIFMHVKNKKELYNCIRVFEWRKKAFVYKRKRNNNNFYD